MNIGVASPWVLTRKALCFLLAAAKDFRVALEIDNALNNVELIRHAQPDILLIEIIDPANDLENVSRMRKLFPEIKILLLAEAADEEFELRAIGAGAWGCVSKQCEPHTLEKALKAVGDGEIWVSHRMATVIIRKSLQRKNSPQENSDELTQREWEILALVSGGYQNKEIASRLFISSNTIKAHLSTIYKKLQVRTRLGAALHYFQQAKQKDDHPVGAGARTGKVPSSGQTGLPGHGGAKSRRST